VRPRVVYSRAEFLAARAELDGRVGVVLTMGALHAGHAALLDAARRDSDRLVATVFVNPTQFRPAEDLAHYPRSLDADLALCAAHGTDLVWAPAVADLYPDGDPQVTVAPGPLGAELEGAARPTHFAGVLTVVAKFFALTRPDVSCFGEKDYQQLTLIRRMVRDLEFGVDVVGVPLVRDPDGLALSSRNAYLSAADRARALVLSRALRAGVDASAHGAGAALDAATQVLATEPEVVADYLELRASDLGPAPPRGEARLLVAAQVGGTRLIDNAAVQL
jgi:pantoate--beta-alanine ligase